MSTLRLIEFIMNISIMVFNTEALTNATEGDLKNWIQDNAIPPIVKNIMFFNSNETMRSKIHNHTKIGLEYWNCDARKSKELILL